MWAEKQRFTAKYEVVKAEKRTKPAVQVMRD